MPAISALENHPVMNRRIPGPNPLLLCFGASILLACWTSPALAQPAGGAGAGTIPTTVKQQYNAANDKATLQQFIAAQVQRLTSEEPAEQSQGRDALVREVEPVGNIVPAPAYLDAYSQFLDGALAPALAVDAPTRTRLNAAIVVARVAERAETTRLLNSVLAALKDKSDAVVLWGLKGARWLLPAVMRNPLLVAANPLLPQIVPAAKAHAQGPLSGAIVREAYDVVALDVLDEVRGKRVTNAMLTLAIPEMQALMDLRVGHYRKSMPAEPSAEPRATLFITHGRVWPLQNPAQQLRSVQLMNDLLWLAAQHVASGNPSPERDQLPQMIQRTAAALMVIPNIGGDAKAAAALKPVTEVSPTMPGVDIKKRVEPVFAAISAIAAYKALTPPPVLGADAAAAPAPNTATAPTTLPGQPATAPTAAPLKPAAPAKPAGPGAPPAPRGAAGAPQPTPPGGGARPAPAPAPAPAPPPAPPPAR